MNIAKLLGLLALLFLVSCAGIGKIPDTETIMIAPFEDGPEAFSITTVSKVERSYTPSETEELMPTLICKRGSDWNKWRAFALKACRLAKRDDEQCDLDVKSVGEGIEILDKLSEVFVRNN